MATIDQGSLELSPTWAIALVCAIFVIASLAAERGIHYVGKWLRGRDLKSLNRALDKMKEELMLLGFISLLLTVFQPVVVGICMPRSYVNHMLPCKLNKAEYFSYGSEGFAAPEGPARKLLTHKISTEGQASLGRILLSASTSSTCIEKGKVPFLSVEALHQLHIFIFAMAVLHVFYSCLTMLLGRIKVHSWNTWEKEAHSEQFDYVEAILRPEFVQKHAKRPWSSSVILSWMVSFLRQFGRSVTRADYLTLRMGFINNHKTNPKFDFHKYVNRVLQDDFKRVVGIRGYLWAFLIIFFLLNVKGWHTYFWIAFIPLILVLVIGTKLQHIITTLAFEIASAQNEMASGGSVQPRDELFWFHHPELILPLLHFVLFQNAFELTFFIWNWATFGFSTCFMDNHVLVIVRLVIGVIVQVLCSYSTLPLYALVTQMGSRYKAAIFKEHIATALTDLHERIKNRKRDKHGSVHMDDTLHSQEGSKGLHSEGSSQQGEFGKHNVLQGKTDLKISLITGGETQHSEQKESSQQCEFGKHNVVQGKTDVEISLITGAETQNSEQKEMTELQKRYISNNLLHKVLQIRDSGATM